MRPETTQKIKSVRVSHSKETCPFCAHKKMVIKPKGKFCTKCGRANKGVEKKKDKFKREYLKPIV